MANHELTQTQAQTTNFETQQGPGEVLLRYNESLKSLVQTYDATCGQITTAYNEGVKGWLKDPNRLDRDYSALAAGASATVHEVAGGVGRQTEEVMVGAQRELIQTLGPRDQVVLQRAGHLIQQTGSSSPDVLGELSNASGTEARTVIEAILDREVLHRARHIARRTGAGSPQVWRELNGASSSEARDAMRATLDEESLHRIKGFAQQTVVNSVIIERELGLNGISSPAALGAVKVSLDYPEVLRRAKAAAGDNANKARGKVEIELEGASGPEARAAMRSMLFNPRHSQEVGPRQSTTSGPEAGNRQRRGPSPEDPTFGNLFDAMFRAASAAGRSGGSQKANQGPASHQQAPDPGRQQAREQAAKEARRKAQEARDKADAEAKARAEKEEAERKAAEEAKARAEREASGPGNKNPYDLLGVDKDADEQAIKQAYRRLARVHHPDVNGTGDDTMLKALLQASEILNDPDRRKEYDKLTDPKKRKWFEEYGSMKGYREPN